MKKEKLYEAIGEIDDNYINDAHLTTKKKSRPAWIKWGAIAACLCLVVALFPLINNMKRTEQPNEPSVSEAPVHFYLDGNLYCFHGDITQELPEGYECIGEVKNIGDAFTGNDVEGNADGKIYMNKSVADTAYFSWAEWNEEADGPAPFLKLELEPKM